MRNVIETHRPARKSKQNVVGMHGQEASIIYMYKPEQAPTADRTSRLNAPPSSPSLKVLDLLGARFPRHALHELVGRHDQHAGRTHGQQTLRVNTLGQLQGRRQLQHSDNVPPRVPS